MVKQNTKKTGSKKRTTPIAKRDTVGAGGIVARTGLASLIVGGVFIFGAPLLFIMAIFYSVFYSAGFFIMPLPLINIGLIIGAIYVIARLLQKPANAKKKKRIVACGFLITFVAIGAISAAGIPVAMSLTTELERGRMEAYLEKKYDEPFTVSDATYRTAVALGDTNGVAANAFPDADSTASFRVATRDGQSNYYEGYGAIVINKEKSALQQFLTTELFGNILDQKVRIDDHIDFIDPPSQSRPGMVGRIVKNGIQYNYQVAIDGPEGEIVVADHQQRINQLSSYIKSRGHAHVSLTYSVGVQKADKRLYGYQCMLGSDLFKETLMTADLENCFKKVPE